MPVLEFRDDDEYREWLRRNPDGFVINIRRSGNPTDARLHHADCSALLAQINRDVRLADQYIKICGKTIDELHEWTYHHVRQEIRPCGTCRGSTGTHHDDAQLCPDCCSYQLSKTGKCPSCDEE